MTNVGTHFSILPPIRSLAGTRFDTDEEAIQFFTDDVREKFDSYKDHDIQAMTAFGKSVGATDSEQIAKVLGQRGVEVKQAGVILGMMAATAIGADPSLSVATRLTAGASLGYPMNSWTLPTSPQLELGVGLKTDADTFGHSVEEKLDWLTDRVTNLADEMRPDDRQSLVKFGKLIAASDDAALESKLIARGCDQEQADLAMGVLTTNGIGSNLAMAHLVEILKEGHAPLCDLIDGAGPEA